MNQNKILVFVVLLSCITLSGCVDESLIQQKILSTWISTDKRVTLDFVDNDSFYKNGDNYDYKLYGDSIKVRYNGMLDIYVSPTMHKFSLEKNVLIIDFSNRNCYGFELNKATYTKL